MFPWSIATRNEAKQKGAKRIASGQGTRKNEIMSGGDACRDSNTENELRIEQKRRN